MSARRIASLLLALAVLVGGPAVWSQEQGQRLSEEFRAVAVANNELGSGIGRIDMRVNRWSTPAQSARLAATLREKGSEAMLEALQDMPEVGFIRTPDSLAYPLHYAFQVEEADGARRIVLATDRPIGFWEAANRPRTIDYPFTVIQMRIGPEGKGKGTLSYAAKIEAAGDNIVLENFATSPVMLTEIEAEAREN